MSENAAQYRPAGPSMVRLFPALWANRLDLLGYLQRLYRRYGDFVFFRLGLRRVYCLNHPDLIREVLVTKAKSFGRGKTWLNARYVLGEGLLTSEGDLHKRQRRLLQPAFTRKRVAAFADVIITSARNEIAKWKPGDSLNVADTMTGLTLDVIAHTMFGADIEGQTQPIADALDTIQDAFVRVPIRLPANLIKMLGVKSSLLEARDHLDQTVNRIIDNRRSSGVENDDMLSRLLAARDVEGDGVGMSDQQIRDEAMTMFLAGHETVATAMTWTWHLLSRHPECEARLHEEIDAVLGDRLPTADDVDQLVYAERVVAEAMRLYPPVWAVARRTLEPVTVGGVDLPAGASVLMLPYAIQRDPRYFDEPDRFDPDRWERDGSSGRPHFAYFPFGGGPHQCIGEPLAWLEAKLLLATIAQRWRLVGQADRDVLMSPRITLRPKDPLWMTLEPRSRKTQPSSTLPTPPPTTAAPNR